MMTDYFKQIRKVGRGVPFDNLFGQMSIEVSFSYKGFANINSRLRTFKQRIVVHGRYVTGCIH